MPGRMFEVGISSMGAHGSVGRLLGLLRLYRVWQTLVEAL